MSAEHVRSLIVGVCEGRELEHAAWDGCWRPGCGSSCVAAVLMLHGSHGLAGSWWPRSGLAGREACCCAEGRGISAMKDAAAPVASGSNSHHARLRPRTHSRVRILRTQARPRKYGFAAYGVRGTCLNRAPCQGSVSRLAGLWARPGVERRRCELMVALGSSPVAPSPASAC